MSDEGAWYSIGAGFGDVWAALHYCLRESERTKNPATITRWCCPNQDIDRSGMMSEMLGLIEAPGTSIKILQERGTRYMGGLCWKALYFPTSRKWSEPGMGSHVAYQFDGVSAAHLKNPRDGDVGRFMDWARANGVPVIPVGLPLSMRECVDVLASARAFVGCCSGMSTLALSVGVPTYVIEYDVKIDWWYGPNRVIKREGMQSFIRRGLS